MTDWLMVIITGIYVIATIVLCAFNYSTSKAAQLQVEKMQEQFDEENRPKIDIHFDMIRSGLACFVIENVGRTAAENVCVRLNDSFLDNLEDHLAERFIALSEANLYLSSGQKAYLLLGGQNRFEIISRTVAKFDVTYKGYSEHMEIDLSQYKGFLLYQSPLEDISKHLKHIQEDNKRHFSKMEHLTKEICRNQSDKSKMAVEPDSCAQQL